MWLFGLRCLIVTRRFILLDKDVEDKWGICHNLGYILVAVLLVALGTAAATKRTGIIYRITVVVVIVERVRVVVEVSNSRICYVRGVANLAVGTISVSNY